MLKIEVCPECGSELLVLTCDIRQGYSEIYIFTIDPLTAPKEILEEAQLIFTNV